MALILLLVNITHQDDSSTKTAAYEDNFTERREITQLKKWWDALCELGPIFGYHTEGSKIWFIVKGNQQHAVVTLQETKVKITTRCQRHLGAVSNSTYINVNVHKFKTK